MLTSFVHVAALVLGVLVTEIRVADAGDAGAICTQMYPDMTHPQICEDGGPSTFFAEHLSGVPAMDPH